MVPQQFSRIDDARMFNGVIVVIKQLSNNKDNIFAIDK